MLVPIVSAENRHIYTYIYVFASCYWDNLKERIYDFFLESPMHLQFLLRSLFFSLILAISLNAFSSIQLSSNPGSPLPKRGQGISRIGNAALSKRQTVWLGVSDDVRISYLPH